MLRPGGATRWRPTLGQGFGATFVALALVLAALLWLFYSGSRATLLEASEQLMGETALRVAGAVEGHLARAERVVVDFESDLASGLVRVDEPGAARAALLAELSRHEGVSALSLTHGVADGFFEEDQSDHEAGEVRLRAEGRWQVSVARADGRTRVSTVSKEGDQWEARGAPGGPGPRLPAVVSSPAGADSARAESGAGAREPAGSGSPRALAATRAVPSGPAGTGADPALATTRAGTRELAGTGADSAHAAAGAGPHVPTGSASRPTIAADEVLPATDPTLHPTFTSPARRDQRGNLLWSDLSFAEGPGQHRVVTVQKALWSDAGAVAVLRVSLLTDRVDELTRVELEERAGRRPVVFLADEHGRLVARVSAEDKVEEVEGDEVRVVPAALTAPLTAALASPLLGEVGPGQSGLTRLDVEGERYLLNVRVLPEGRTRGWRVATLAPESWFLGSLQRELRSVLAAAALLVLASLAGGALLLRATRRDLGGLIGEATRLRRFDFAPAVASQPVFRDVQLAADSLEQAKTALRALGKFAPLDLVRQLYEARVEPTLGGRVRDLSLVFSDIEGFTTISEKLPLDVLAVALGHYLEAMTRAIHRTHGIIDKYTGDGVMALWNAPSLVEHHPRRACEAVLACIEETEQLFSSPRWAGLPRWRTRFGIHRAEVSVGHFGAPDRMSYTAMGDGVNLAARLESLNKQYGTFALVSADVEREARAAFSFRRLDRVAVKGKQQGVEVFELLGPRGDGERPLAVTHYEAALAAYFERRFGRALDLLGEAPDDRPSQLLAERCRRLLADPPPPDWDGVSHATEK